MVQDIDNTKAQRVHREWQVSQLLLPPSCPGSLTFTGCPRLTARAADPAERSLRPSQEAHSFNTFPLFDSHNSLMRWML